ncbi:MAG: PKD domain-containing protein, partial [Flavobacteriales bacterium]|nr:PKD domain-containing protein [Flavobacteriales bacterium]
ARIVEVHPFIQAAFNSDSIGCSPLPVSFINQSFGAQSYAWSFGDNTTATDINPNHIYTNATNSNQNYLAKMIAISTEGCLDSAEKNIIVYPKPTASYTLSTNAGCQPLEVTFTNGSSLADSCVWNYGDLDSFKLCTPTNVHIYTNTTSFFPIDYSSELFVFTNDGCSDTFDIDITVNPEVIADFTSIDSGCSPLNVNFQNQSVGANSYDWTFGDGITDTLVNPFHTYTNATFLDEVNSLRMIASSQFGCSDTIEKDIIVFAKPDAQFSIDASLGCHPLPVTFTNNSTIADSCRWNFGDGSAVVDTCFNNRVYTYQNNFSTLPVTRTAALFVFTDNGCQDTFDIDITINPEVIASFSSLDSGCSPLQVRFQNQSIGANSYDWTFGDGASDTLLNPSHLYNNTSFVDQVNNMRLIASSQYGCSDTIEKDIIVFAKPEAQFSIDASLGCHPLPVTFINNSTIADSCRWNFGDGSTVVDTCFNNRVYTYQNNFSTLPVTRTAALFVFTDNGCRDTFNLDITINPEVIANFSSLDSGCSPLPVNFQNLSIGANNYDWTFGDGASDTLLNPSHLYNNTSFVDQVNNMRLIVSSQYGCSDTIEKVISVFAKPNAQFSTDVSAGCHPLEVNFTNTSSIADSCRWNFGDGSPVLDTCFLNLSRLHVYENTISSFPLNRTAQLFVYTSNGCSDTINQNITVNPNIEAAFAGPTEGCSPLAASFTNQSIGATGFQWTYGDGGSDTLRDPSHLYLNLGQLDVTYITRLVVTNDFGCSSDSEIVVTVFPKPVADYTIDVNDGCQPLLVQFTNNSSLADVCDWTYGDGNLNLNDCTPVTNYTYFNTQSLVPVTNISELIVSTVNGCSDTLTRNISVRPQVIAAFTTDADSCAPVDATFRSQSSGAFEFDWNFGDGGIGTGQVIAHQFTNIGAVDSVYQVRLIAKSAFNCNDTAFEDVRVYPTPIVDFTATPITQEFPDATVTLTNNTNNGNWSYLWEYGDQDSSILRNPGTHEYGTWGMYTIKLTANSAFCESSKDVLVTIEAPTPIADFGDSAVGCEPLEVTFTNKSQFGLSYEWDFGDGSPISGAENPGHIYFNEGVYTVSLKVTGFPPGKTDEITKTNYIVVNKTPNANFIMNTTKVFIPNDPVVFSNRSTDADSYTWDFGDGSNSTEQSPVYQYKTEGEFSILLIAETDKGCIDSIRSPTNVIAELEGRIKVPNAFTPNTNGSNGGVVNINPGSGEFNDVFYAKLNGTQKYELNIFNKWGELLFVSKDINIGWDGYYNGQLVQQDVYVWKIAVEFIDGTSLVKVGDLMLLR